MQQCNQLRESSSSPTPRLLYLFFSRQIELPKNQSSVLLHLDPSSILQLLVNRLPPFLITSNSAYRSLFEMPSKTLRLEPLSPGYWDRISPPVDQELWKRFMNGQESDSDASGTESEEPMAGPYTATKSTEPDVRPVKQNSKHDLVSCLKVFEALSIT